MPDSINIPIVSKYDDKGAKQALKDVKELDKLKPEVKVTADTAAATKSIDGLMKKVDLLDSDAATILLTSNATDIASDVAGLLIDLDKLDADDPEVTVKATQINGLKGDLDQIEAKIREVNGIAVAPDANAGGLSTLSGDLDQVETKLKDVNRIKVKPDVDTTPIRRAGDDAGHAAEGIQSGIGPLRGFTDELGGSSAAAGTMANAIIDGGEAIQIFGSQLGISTAALGTISGVLGGVGIAIGAGALAWSAYTAKSKASAKATQENAEAIKDITGVLDDQAKALEDSAKGGGDFFTIFTAGLAKSQKDFDKTAAAANTLGIGVDGIGEAIAKIENKGTRIPFFEDLLKKNIPGLTDELAAGIGRAIDNTENFDQAVNVIRGTYGNAAAEIVLNNRSIVESTEQLNDAQQNVDIEKNAEQWIQSLKGTAEGYALVQQAAKDLKAEGLNDPTNVQLAEKVAVLKSAAENAKELNQAYRDAANPMATYNQLQEDATEQIDRVNQLLLDQADALNGQVDAAIGAADAMVELDDAQQGFIDKAGDATQAAKDYVQAVREHGQKSTEAAEAARHLKDAERDQAKAAYDAAAAAVRMAQDNAAAGGKTLTAKGRVDAFNTSLLSNAHFATPAARSAIGDYIVKANQVPASKATAIKAAIDSGDFATAQRLLDQASRTRTAAIHADADTAAAERELDALERPRTTILYIEGRQVGALRDRGGFVGPEGAIVAERRPEFVRLPGGQQGLVTEPSFVPSGTQVTSGAETERILAAQPSAPSAPVTNVTVNVPRGYHGDVLEDARKAARRSGGLYQRNGR